MSVFTTLDQQDINTLLAAYGKGQALSVQACLSGTVNTNYRVETEQAVYILTLFEKIDRILAEKILTFTHYLYQKGIPCPKPFPAGENQFSFLFKNKPASCISFLQGAALESPSADACFQIGRILAKIHTQGQPYPSRIENQMGSNWRQHTFKRLSKHLSDTPWLGSLIERGIPNTLPRGMVHYDLFRDNALFVDSTLSGIIDFNYACYDSFLYDLCITLNDWCTDWSQAPELNVTRAREMLQGYTEVRSLTSEEQSALAKTLQLAASHFWMSRLETQLFPRTGEGSFIKDPSPYKQLALYYEHSPFTL